MRLRGSLLIAVRSAVALVSVVPRVDAQSASTSPPRWSLAASADLGTVPGLFDASCGPGNAASEGISASVLFRPGRWFLLEGVARRLNRQTDVLCEVTLDQTYPVGPGEYETRDSTFTAPSVPIVETFLRAGVETPPSLPLIRASVGAGHIWHSQLRVGSLALGVGTRGRRLRLYGEVETFMTRLRLSENHHEFTLDSLGGHIPGGSYSVPRTAHPVWSLAHFGIEVPLFVGAVRPDSSR